MVGSEATEVTPAVWTALVIFGCFWLLGMALAYVWKLTERWRFVLAMRWRMRRDA